MKYTIKNNSLAIANIWLLCLLFSIPTQAQQNLTNKVVLEVTDAWEAYKKAVKDKDTSRLIAMTFPIVYCSECYQNTEEEQQYIDSLRADPNDAYVKILEQLYRVDKSTFAINDIPILLNYEAMHQYKYDIIQDKHNLKAIVSNKKLRRGVQGLYAVVLNVSEETDTKPGFHIVINFVKIKNKGYQMCGYSTVP